MYVSTAWTPDSLLLLLLYLLLFSYSLFRQYRLIRTVLGTLSFMFLFDAEIVIMKLII